MRNASLAQLRADVADQADIAGAVGTSSRYTPTLLNRLINQSIQRFRERVSNEASQRFLVAEAGTTGVGPTAPYQFQVLTVPTAAVRTYGLDLTVNGTTHTLSYVPFDARSDYGGPEHTGEPQAWTHFQTRSIALLPAPMQAYDYLLWYLPVATDLSSDSDSFDGISGWEDYVTWDVVCRLIVKDQYPGAYQMAVTYRSDIWADILRAATKVTQAGGGVIGRDSFGARTIGLHRSRRLPDP